jgi:trimethylamine--corrinoid protein Co-methyltransferase
MKGNSPVSRSAFPVFPRIAWLSDSDRNQLFQSALTVLSDIGMQIQHEEAVSLLQQAGCTIQPNQMITIPPDLVHQSIQSAPSSIRVGDRNGNPVMDLGGNRSYFGTGSDLIYSLESETMNRHHCVLDDVARAARVCDNLSNIDFIMSFAHPNDIEPRFAYVAEFRAMAENSTKPLVFTSENRADMACIHQIASLLRGGEDRLKMFPYVIHYAEPISPLKHPYTSLDKLLFCAEKGIPVIYSPAPIAGSTAPMTVAGHVVQGLAECLCGLVVHQLKSPGAPFVMGMGPAVLDMATGQCSYNAPEYYMAYMSMIEMTHHLDLPSWGYAGTSDSQIPDEQACLEAAILTFISAMCGANLNHDVGYLDFGRTGCLEMVVIMDEVIDQVRRIRKGMIIDVEETAVEVIRQVGVGGEFLTHDHTYRHLRSTQWRPSLLHRDGYEAWEANGKKSLLTRARERLQEILTTHHAPTIPETTAAEIEKEIRRFSVQ